MEWADIESAPTDGRKFLACDPSGVRCLMAVDGNRTETWQIDAPHMVVIEPIYWMPLPEPPQ